MRAVQRGGKWGSTRSTSTSCRPRPSASVCSLFLPPMGRRAVNWRCAFAKLSVGQHFRTYCAVHAGAVLPGYYLLNYLHFPEISLTLPRLAGLFDQVRGAGSALVRTGEPTACRKNDARKSSANAPLTARPA